MYRTNCARRSRDCASLLALAQEKPGRGPEYLQRIEQEAERLEELIGQLLSSQAQDIVLDTHIDLVALLQQLCADANFEGQGSGQTVPLQYRYRTGDLSTARLTCCARALRISCATPCNTRLKIPWWPSP